MKRKRKAMDATVPFEALFLSLAAAGRALDEAPKPITTDAFTVARKAVFACLEREGYGPDVAEVMQRRIKALMITCADNTDLLSPWLTQKGPADALLQAACFAPYCKCGGPGHPHLHAAELIRLTKAFEASEGIGGRA